MALDHTSEPVKILFTEHISPGLSEDKLWHYYIMPAMKQLPKNVYDICYYGFTEMVNNVIDHSEGNAIVVSTKINDGGVEFVIIDDGVGIFRKIRHALKLDSVREAILHLSKGKFTTDPDRHSGEGIFFTSRVMTDFRIWSSELFYHFSEEEWLFVPEKKIVENPGTIIGMSVALNTSKSLKDVFDTYTDDEHGFTKTEVHVSLSADPDDFHVSRSQAKRLMAGLEKFESLTLDFDGIESVGQGFVDEIFRVFQNHNPQIVIDYVNANEDVAAMIRRGLHTLR